MATTTSTKPQLSQLKTPMSATYPSELRSPMVSTPTFFKREEKLESLNTPVTPPAAYLDFLAKLSPTLMSPPTSAFPPSTLTEKPALPSTASSESVASIASSASVTSTAGQVPSESSNPASPRSHPSSRSSSCSSFSAEALRAETRCTQITIPPPSAFTAPLSARTPRRLLIPQSPYSPGTVRSPLSATLYSPLSALSPRDVDPDNAGTSSKRAVTVRQIVTRTVTFARQPAPKVEPVPASKKRKIDS